MKKLLIGLAPALALTALFAATAAAQTECYRRDQRELPSERASIDPSEGLIGLPVLRKGTLP